ncbi:MAG: type II toxin-antitoxin system RelE/ParE family toxin [Gammaproteobacteria bacterium]
MARVIFFMDQDCMVLVNGFIKKTQRTPLTELVLAKKRKKQYEKMRSKIKK